MTVVTVSRGGSGRVVGRPSLARKGEGSKPVQPLAGARGPSLKGSPELPKSGGKTVLRARRVTSIAAPPECVLACLASHASGVWTYHSS